MDLDQETAKELVKSVIDGFEEESIVNAESVTLFLCRECLPYLTKMNIPANIVQAINGLAEKNEDLTAAESLTDLVIAQDGRLQRVIVAGFGKGDECKPNNLRKAAGSAARALIAAKIKQTAVVAPILSNPARAHYLAALAEGLVLGGSSCRRRSKSWECSSPKEPRWSAPRGVRKIRNRCSAPTRSRSSQTCRWRC